MNDSENAEEALARRLEALEQRVAELERRTPNQPAFSGSPWASASPAETLASSSQSQGAGLLALVGKAMLVVAGAYLLRAATAYSAIPRIPLVIVAIAYAFAWLIPAARTKAQNQFPKLIWAGTSALILLPMIWELTMRFRILSAAPAASVLGLYVIVAAILEWNRHFAEIAWVAVTSVSITAFALAVTTHDLVPFIAVLLVVAAVGEIAVARERTLRVRPLVAVIADGAILALIWIYSGPAAAREVYPAVSSALVPILALLLLSLYAASASSQTILLRRGISVFETSQTLTAFALTCWSFLAFRSVTAEIVLGALCIVASAAGYAVSFGWFRRVYAQRNHHVYATGSLVLLLVGCFLLLPATGLAIGLGIFAVGMSFAAPRVSAVSVGFQGLAALVVTAAATGQLLWNARTFTGPFPGAPGGTITVVAASAVLCSVALLRSSFESRWKPLLVLTGAALGVFASAGFLVWGLVWVGGQFRAAPFAPGSQYVAITRTIVACAFAIGLAWSGPKWQRRELAWLAWPVLALTAVELLFEDMREGHLAFMAASIFLYAVTLLVVSRVIRPKTGTQGENRPENPDAGPE